MTRVYLPLVVRNEGLNCGTGAGGFHPKNWCWRGGGNAPAGWNGWASKGVPLPKLPDLGKADFKDHKVQPPRLSLPKRGMPEDDSTSLKVAKFLGGSTGAYLAVDGSGKKYVIKKPGKATKEHLASESAANDVYRAAGLDAPASRIVTKGTGNLPAGSKVSEYAEGTPLSELKGTAKTAAIKELRKGFVVDALLANWDVIGMHQDNIVVGKDGKVWRIDNGGSFDFRAQGGSKKFGNLVLELDSMRESEQGKKIFGALSNADIAKQIPGVLAKRDAIVAATPPHLRVTMEKRMNDLADFAALHAPAPAKPKVAKPKVAKTEADGTPKEKKPKVPKPVVDPKNAVEVAKTVKIVDPGISKPIPSADIPKVHGDYIWLQDVSVRESVRFYTSNEYKNFNERARACPPKFGCLGDEDRKKMATLIAAVDKAPRYEPTTIYRGIDVKQEGAPEFLNALRGGGTFEFPSITSATTSANVAASYTSGAMFVIKGATRGLYADQHSSFPGEKEVILSPTAKYRVARITASDKYGGIELLELEEVDG